VELGCPSLRQSRKDSKKKKKVGGEGNQTPVCVCEFESQNVNPPTCSPLVQKPSKSIAIQLIWTKFHFSIRGHGNCRKNFKKGKNAKGFPNPNYIGLD